LCQPRNGKNLINPNFPSWKGTHHSRYHLASLKEKLTVNEHSRRHITSINCNQNICMHAQVNLTISVSSMNPSELARLALLLCLNKRPSCARPTVHPSAHDVPHTQLHKPSSLSRGAFDLSPTRTNPRNRSFCSSMKFLHRVDGARQHAEEIEKRGRRSGGRRRLFTWFWLWVLFVA
jgi:hypothetical protein